jgi:AcrR family transcriptional regulator
VTSLASERARRAQGRLPSGRSHIPREVITKSQRERIVDATAAIVAEKGLAKLTIPEIARRANVSHQTFYEMYASKHDAFLGAQKVGLHQALHVTIDAYDAHQDSWPLAVSAGLRALIEYLSTEPAHAHLSVVDTFAASPDALEIRTRALRAFAAYLRRGHELAPAAPRVASEAIAGGIWQVLHHYIANDRIAELPALAPQIVYLALTPFLGAERAAETALAPSA